MRNPRGFGPGGSCVIHVILSEQSESKDLPAHIGKKTPRLALLTQNTKQERPAKDAPVMIFLYDFLKDVNCKFKLDTQR